MTGLPSATILYHYFHPDDVVSARHHSDLAEGLAHRGWNVVAHPCHRGCRDESQKFPLRDFWNGVAIERVWRPNLKQSSNVGRVLNAAWMLAAWSWIALTSKRRRDEVTIVGTDPILSVLSALPFRFFRPECRVAHWCFDLYPEAAIADGLLRERSIPVRVLKTLLTAAYRKCHLLADLGSCMAKSLEKYGSPAVASTLTPWALVEPAAIAEPDPSVRTKLFGEKASIGLLYSGTFGRAHSYAEFLELARLLRGTGVEFCFAGRGNRADELKQATTADDTNIRFAGFAPEAELEARLSACDLHLVSLRPEWTGTVVPSKFFGALAAGRGVLYAGSPDSAIAKWIEEYRVGFVLKSGKISDVANELLRAASNPAEIVAMRRRCFEAYHRHFAKAAVLDRFDAALRATLRPR